MGFLSLSAGVYGLTAALSSAWLAERCTSFPTRMEASRNMEEILFAEYQMLYTTYEGYNDQVLTLKGWSATVGIAALLAAYTKGVAASGRVGVLVAALTAIPFWLTETFWKLFQQSYLARIDAIETCFRTSVTECTAVQISASWTASFHEERFSTWMGIAFDPHVLLPHGFLFAVGLGLWAVYPPR
jgi:hypothetical protein